MLNRRQHRRIFFAWFGTVAFYMYVFKVFLRTNPAPPQMDERMLVNSFQTVDNSTSVLVYTAYYYHSHKVIRVIGVTSLERPALNCLLRYTGKQPKLIKAKTTIIPEHHGLRNKAIFIDCNMKNIDVPGEVSILKQTKSADRRYDIVSNILYLERNPTKTTRRNFTVCLSPLHSSFSEKWRVLEWLEMNIMLGVEKFYVYVHSCTKDVMQLLQKYQAKNYVVIIKWTIPSPLCDLNSKDMHYCGQMVALNDCLYRSKGNSLYIAVIDIDEFIIPQINEDITWNDMIERLPNKSAYIFRHVLYFPNKNNSFYTNGYITQSGFLKNAYIYGINNRTKYISVADKTDILGIHFPWEPMGTEHVVSPSIGLLHHYRHGFIKHVDYKGIPCNTTRKYYRQLEKRISYFKKFDNFRY